METVLSVEKEINGKKMRLSILQDDYATDPREWDNLGHMVCFHRRYNLGDEHEFESAVEFVDFLDKLQKRDAVIARPLYLYDHSGVTMNTGGFYQYDPQGWDWGKVGYIYVTKERVREVFKVKQVSPRLKLQVLEILQAEVDEYDMYLRGEVYGYRIEELVPCFGCGHVDSEIIDSCGGFFGWDFEKSGMLSEIPSEWHELIKQEV